MFCLNFNKEENDSSSKSKMKRLKQSADFTEFLQKNYHKSNDIVTIVFLSWGCLCIALMEINWYQKWESYLMHWGHLNSCGYNPEILSIRKTKTKNGFTEYYWIFFLFEKKSHWRSKWLNGPMVQFLALPTFYENPIHALSQRQRP